MFFKTLRLSVKREIEQLKALHRIELQEANAALEREKLKLAQEHELKITETVTLLKLESQQKIAQQKLDYDRKLDAIKVESDSILMQAKEQVIKEGYDKLSAAMSKLHEEGNVTTRFVQDLALSMTKNPITSKVKVLTGTVKNK
jgi:hypothetical protein